jgi:hypothetical protein
VLISLPLAITGMANFKTPLVYMNEIPDYS